MAACLAPAHALTQGTLGTREENETWIPIDLTMTAR